MKVFSALTKWLNKGCLLDDVVSDPKRNNFKLIRLIAALIVVAIHCINFSSYSYLNLIGSFGVPAFFFLSGLLVSNSFENSSSLKSYLWKRVLRIYPAAVLIILLCALVVGPLITTLPLKDYFTHPAFIRNVLSVFLIQEYDTLPGVFENSVLNTTGINSSLWTLPLEIKLYVLVVIWGLFTSHYKNCILLIVAFLLVIPVTLNSASIELFIKTHLHKSFAIFPYVSSIPLFILGMLCNAWKNKIVIKNYWFLLIVVVFISMVPLNLTNYFIHLVVATVVLYVAGLKSSLLKMITPKSDFSYGIYISAFPIEQLVANYTPIGNNPYPLFFTTAILSFLFAMFSWHMIEKKALGLKNCVK